MDNASSAAQAASARRRRRMVPIIDARFQWKYTVLIMALGVGVTAIMGSLLFRAHRDTSRLLDLDERIREHVLRGDQIFLLYLIMTVIAMAIVLAVWGLIVTHRISGPLFIVARYLDVLADGQYPDMRPLRKRDELQSFFAAFEEAVTALKNRDTQSLAALEALLAEHKQGKMTLDAAIKVLEGQRQQLHAALNPDTQD